MKCTHCMGVFGYRSTNRGEQKLRNQKHAAASKFCSTAEPHSALPHHSSISGFVSEHTQSHTQAHHEQRNNQYSRHPTPTRSSSVKTVLSISMSAKAQAPSSAMLHPLCNKSSQCRNMCKIRAHQHFAASHLPGRFASNRGCFSKHSPTLPHSPSRQYSHS